MAFEDEIEINWGRAAPGTFDAEAAGIVKATGGDAMLSVSIGAATGTFVGTDVSFADNALRPFFGVEDSMSDVEGMVRAGLSTSAGFLCMQSVQNITLPKNANWLDPVKL